MTAAALFNEAWAGIQLSKDSFFVTLSNRLVQIRLRDQLLVLAGAYALIWVLLMPVLMPLQLLGLISMSNVFFTVMSSQSLVGVALRTIAFPISLHFLAPMLSIELFDAVMRDLSPPLYERLRDAPVIPLRVWLPVHLKRTLPLLAAGLVLWLFSNVPVFGVVFTAIGHFALLWSVFASRRLALWLTVAIACTGAVGLHGLRILLATRSLGSEQCDLFLYRFFARTENLAEGANTSDAAKYKQTLRKRREFIHSHLPFVLGFALPYALAIQFVPFGVAVYVVAIGAGAVLAKHIFETTGDSEHLSSHPQRIE